MRRLAGVYARPDQDREDLMQEILLALWQALPAFRSVRQLNRVTSPDSIASALMPHAAEPRTV